MEQNKLVIGGVVLVLIFIVGGYLMAGRADAPSELIGDNNTEQSLGDRMVDSAKMSLSGMLALGQSQTCTFSDSSNGTESNGTVYMSGGKMRGDFTSSARGQIETTHMISDGKESRIWIDGQADGYLMKMPENTDTTASPDTPISSDGTTQMPIDMNDDASNYNCTSWRTDASVFVPPANVDFISMEDMMKGMMPGVASPSAGAQGGGSAGYGGSYDATSMKAMQCSTCEQVQDPASKAECRTAFQCQ